MWACTYSILGLCQKCQAWSPIMAFKFWSNGSAYVHLGNSLQAQASLRRPVICDAVVADVAEWYMDVGLGYA